MPDPRTTAGHTITRLLEAWAGGESDAAERLFPLVYRELSAIAANLLRRERRGPLETSELVHEAYLKLLDPRGLELADRRHFYNVVARAMRQVLVDEARRREAGKRGAGQVPLSLEHAVGLPVRGSEDVLILDRLLDDLEQLDARQAEVVTLRVFGGLTIDEVAETQGVSAPTVQRDWRMARAWLVRALAPGSS